MSATSFSIEKSTPFITAQEESLFSLISVTIVMLIGFLQLSNLVVTYIVTVETFKDRIKLFRT